MNYTYESPFDNRYGSGAIKLIFSDYFKFTTWRQYWLELAIAEAKLGLDISQSQINEMAEHVHTVDIERAREIEQEIHHDVMAHIKHFAEQCPSAAPIIHLGATSCYVTDNTEIDQIDSALRCIGESLTTLIKSILKQTKKYEGLAVPAYTHLQMAQPTTMGKRMAMWLQDFMIDLDQINYALEHLAYLGCRGATGSSASFLRLFNGDKNKVRELEKLIFAGKRVFPISGQTYTRKQDFIVGQILAGIAQSAAKMSNDLRLMAGFGEVTESFGIRQVGSSAMPYKRNPIKCERIAALARHVQNNLQNFSFNASSQWLERTLDDSANRRIVIPEMFIAIGEIINLCSQVINGLTVNKEIIEVTLEENKYKTALEAILMEEVKEGEDRQEIHEKIREISTQGNFDPIKTFEQVSNLLELSPEKISDVLQVDTGMSKQYTEDVIRSVQEFLHEKQTA